MGTRELGNVEEEGGSRSAEEDKNFETMLSLKLKPPVREKH